jgi:allantoate deiminase
MALRHDALCAAAEFVLSVEALACDLPGLVATVGQANVQPGASNVIPGQVTLSLDIRHQDNAVREQACRQLEGRTREIGLARGVLPTWQYLQGHDAVPCAPHLSELFAQVIKELGYPVHTLTSGAGHDAAVLSKLTDIAMLFVRCKGGISHNPAESVTPEDVGIAINVLERFLHLLGESSLHTGG